MTQHSATAFKIFTAEQWAQFSRTASSMAPRWILPMAIFTSPPPTSCRARSTSISPDRAGWSSPKLTSPALARC